MRKLLFALALGAAAWLGASAAQAQTVPTGSLPTGPAAQTVSAEPATPPAAAGAAPAAQAAPGGAALGAPAGPAPVAPGAPAGAGPAIAPVPGPVGPLPGPAAPCGDHGCCVETKKVCVPEHTTIKVFKVIYGSECKDFCLRHCSLFGGHGSGHGDTGCAGCEGHGGHHDRVYCPSLGCGCSHPMTKRVLLKKSVEVCECPDYKCHVEEHAVAPKCCATGCPAAGCPAPCAGATGAAPPASLPPGTQVIPIGPPAGAPPMMPPASGYIAPPMPLASPTASEPAPMPTTSGTHN